MKPILAIDITKNRKNETPNSESFLNKKTDEKLLQSIFELSVEAKNSAEKAVPSEFYRIGMYFFGMVGLALIFGLISGISENGIPKNNMSFYIVSGIAIALVLLTIIIFLCYLKKKKDLKQTPFVNNAENRLNQAKDAIFAQMGVPFNTPETDVLIFKYKEKNGEIYPCEKGLQFTRFFNSIFKFHLSDGFLYLSNIEAQYKILNPVFKAIHTVNKKADFPFWNKEKGFKHPDYKQFKIYNTALGIFVCKNYYILEIETNGESYGIYFPNYELPFFKELTGL